ETNGHSVAMATEPPIGLKLERGWTQQATFMNSKPRGRRQLSVIRAAVRCVDQPGSEPDHPLVVGLVRGTVSPESQATVHCSHFTRADDLYKGRMNERARGNRP